MGKTFYWSPIPTSFANFPELSQKVFKLHDPGFWLRKDVLDYTEIKDSSSALRYLRKKVYNPAWEQFLYLLAQTKKTYNYPLLMLDFVVREKEELWLSLSPRDYNNPLFRIIDRLDSLESWEIAEDIALFAPFVLVNSQPYFYVFIDDHNDLVVYERISKHENIWSYRLFRKVKSKYKDLPIKQIKEIAKEYMKGNREPLKEISTSLGKVTSSLFKEYGLVPCKIK